MQKCFDKSFTELCFFSILFKCFLIITQIVLKIIMRGSFQAFL